MKQSSILQMIAVSICCLIITTPSFAKNECVKVKGEGVIISGDIPSAKVEAVARAKWSAVEQVAGVDIKSRTIVENSMLLDDIISAKARGTVRSFKILSEKIGRDTVIVHVNACIEPSSATEAVSSMALNTAISIYIPSRQLGNDTTATFDDTNILSETLVGKLAERGFTVRDIAESHALKANEIESSLRRGDFLSYRGLVYKYLSNSILIGKVEPTVSATKGETTVFKFRQPFNTVTARLTYRLLTRDISGKMVVLAAGTEEAKGLAPTNQDAYATALHELANKFIPIIEEKIKSRMDEISNKIRVKVEGVKEPSETFALREILQKITWVTSVEDAGLDEFQVSFPDNPIYLANGLGQKGFKIVSYSRDRITVRNK